MSTNQEQPTSRTYGEKPQDKEQYNTRVYSKAIQDEIIKKESDPVYLIKKLISITYSYDRSLRGLSYSITVLAISFILLVLKELISKIQYLIK